MASSRSGEINSVIGFPRTVQNRGTGTIEATEVLVSAKVPARILELTVEEGAAVTAGQVLARLDCAELEVRRAQAEAQVAQAKAARLQAIAS